MGTTGISKRAAPVLFPSTDTFLYLEANPKTQFVFRPLRSRRRGRPLGLVKPLLGTATAEAFKRDGYRC